MLKALRNKKGVTLVELLAVVVILGIIAAIAVPTIGNLIKNQQEKADIATLQNVISSAKLYNLAEGEDLFLLDELDTNNYIDLSDYKFGIDNEVTGTTSDIIYIQVIGSVVTFHEAGTPLTNPGTAIELIYVNGTDIQLTTTGQYVATP